jgi:flagellin
MAINAISGLTLNFRNSVEGAEKASAKDMLRLSTGLRINSAADDAAGVAISSRMNAQSRGMAMAIRNANDLLSMTQTAEGAAKDINDALQRMRELSIQAANDTLNASDRKNINLEIGLLKEHINAISKQTKFNNINLLDGSLKNTSFQIGGNTQDTLKLSMPALDTSSLAQTPVTNKFKLTFTALAAGQSVTVAGLTFKATADTTAAEVTAAFSNLAENATTGAGTTTGEYGGSFTGFASGNADGTTVELTTTASNMKGDVPKVAVMQIDAIVTNSYKLTFSGLLSGQSVTVAGLTYTATSDTTAANVASAFANLTEGATTGSGATGTYSGKFTGFGTANASGRDLDITSDSLNPSGTSPSVSVTQSSNPRTTSTYNIQFTDLIAGQSVTVGGLTYTAASDEMASNVANAFANLNEGAINGPGLGNYSGILSGFNTGISTNNLVYLVSTSNNLHGTAPNLSSSAGQAPTMPLITTIQGAAEIQAQNGVLYQEDYFLPIDSGAPRYGFPAVGDQITINGLTANFTYFLNPTTSDLNGVRDTQFIMSNFKTGASTSAHNITNPGAGTIFSGDFTGNYHVEYSPHYSYGTSVVDGMTIKVVSDMWNNSVNNAGNQISISSNITNQITKISVTNEVSPVNYSPAISENTLVDFSSISTLQKGASITIGGMKFTAATDVRGIDLGILFVTKLIGNSSQNSWLDSYGVFSGSIGNFHLATAANNTFSVTSNVWGVNVPDIQVTTEGVPAPTPPTSIHINSVTQPNAVSPTVANGSSSTTVPATVPSIDQEASSLYELPHSLEAITVETQQDASDAIQVIDTSIEAVSKFEAELGAVQNRVESVISNLTTANTDLKASLSRIEDADYAVETSNMAKHQIISQAAMAMLAQANQSTNTVASLLKSVG